ncbi:uncharacterized protein BXZ73DRAFT_79205 [Epithele typhae]|uniref:uncharacterized protein n=1 Tax=Epithele typhae TaxID=378194 RepID=UPI002007F552|nr:uncharacterized protein BXZ73DRAFT_79205 [Epithele typhae]KAH9924647.1 hypothetical protein BXZ73DRAFT_79205 [Epithele typhae]
MHAKTRERLANGQGSLLAATEFWHSMVFLIICPSTHMLVMIPYGFFFPNAHNDSFVTRCTSFEHAGTAGLAWRTELEVEKLRCESLVSQTGIPSALKRISLLSAVHSRVILYLMPLQELRYRLGCLHLRRQTRPNTRRRTALKSRATMYHRPQQQQRGDEVCSDHIRSSLATGTFERRTALMDLPFGAENMGRNVGAGSIADPLNKRLPRAIRPAPRRNNRSFCSHPTIRWRPASPRAERSLKFGTDCEDGGSLRDIDVGCRVRRGLPAESWPLTTDALSDAAAVAASGDRATLTSRDGSCAPHASCTA